MWLALLSVGGNMDTAYADELDSWPWIRCLRWMKHHPQEVRRTWERTLKARGLAAARAGRLPAAIRLLDQAQRKAPWPDPDLEAHLAELRAIRRYRRRLQNRPGDPEALVELGKALMAQELADEALGCFRKAAALAPTYAEAHVMIGLELHYRDDLGGAEEAYREALRHEPTQPIAQHYLDLIERGVPLHDSSGELALVAGG